MWSQTRRIIRVRWRQHLQGEGKAESCVAATDGSYCQSPIVFYVGRSSAVDEFLARPVPDALEASATANSKPLALATGQCTDVKAIAIVEVVVQRGQRCTNGCVGMRRRVLGYESFVQDDAREAIVQRVLPGKAVAKKM